MYITYNIDGWEGKSGLVRWRLVLIKKCVFSHNYVESCYIKNIEECAWSWFKKFELYKPMQWDIGLSSVRTMRSFYSLMSNVILMLHCLMDQISEVVTYVCWIRLPLIGLRSKFNWGEFMAALMMTGLLYLMLGSRMLLGEWNGAIGFTSVLLQIK